MCDLIEPRTDWRLLRRSPDAHARATPRKRRTRMRHSKQRVSRRCPRGHPTARRGRGVERAGARSHRQKHPRRIRFQPGPRSARRPSSAPLVMWSSGSALSHQSGLFASHRPCEEKAADSRTVLSPGLGPRARQALGAERCVSALFRTRRAQHSRSEWRQRQSQNASRRSGYAVGL